MRREVAHAADLDILILGPVPPPLGGISVHVSRLVPLLKDAGLRVGVLNHFASKEVPYVVGALKRNPLNYYRLPRKVSTHIVHYHHSSWLQLLAVALGRGRTPTRYIVTLHAGNIHEHFPQLTSKVPLVARATLWALRRFDRVILVNPEIAPIIGGRLHGQRVEVMPAFLQSTDEEFRYDASLEGFLNSGRILVVAAHGVQFLRDGRDLYGLDTAVQAFADLARQRADLRLLVFIARRPSVYGLRARRHLMKLERRLEKAGIRDRALVVFGLPLAPAFRQNSIFVRPTRAEGDAVSVREAQHADVPVVASDVVTRPNGVVPFSVGNASALSEAIEEVVEQTNYPTGAAGDAASQTVEPSLANPLIRLYRAELDARTSGAPILADA